MFQDLQPCEIILMAVVMLHGESENSLSLYQHRRAVDTVVRQQIPVGNSLLHRNIFPRRGPVGIHQFSSGGTKHASCLPEKFQLFSQFSLRPPVVRVKESNILPFCFPDAQIAGTCRSKIPVVPEITETAFISVRIQYFFCVVCRAVVDHQKFQGNILGIYGINCFFYISRAVIYRHNN